MYRIAWVLINSKCTLFQNKFARYLNTRIEMFVLAEPNYYTVSVKTVQ